MIGSWGKKEKFFSSLMRNDSRIKTFVQREDKENNIYLSVQRGGEKECQNKIS